MHRPHHDTTVEPKAILHEETLAVPLTDTREGETVYDVVILWLTLLGALAGGILLGLLAWAIVDGPLPITGMGQFAAAGTGAAVFTGAGIGVALGGLAGALAGVYRIPRRYYEEENEK